MKQGRTVLEAKRYGIYGCRPDATLLQAARRMVEEDVSALVVVDDDGCLAGVISRTDMLRAHLERADWANQAVASHMSRDVVSVTGEDDLRSVARLLLEKHIHRVVVVRDDGGRRRPVAVISDADLVYHMLRDG
jgi:CBS domain-containing protein